MSSHLAGGRLLYRHVASVSSTVSKLLVQDVEHDAMRRLDALAQRSFLAGGDDAVGRQDYYRFHDPALIIDLRPQ